MKFFVVLSAIVAVACATQGQWTINELSAALQDPTTDPAVIPFLESALNELMLAAFTGSPQTTVSVSTAVQDISSWSLHELSTAVQDPSTNPELLPYLEHALDTMMQNIFNGQQQESIIVATPVGLLPSETILIPAPVTVVETPVAPVTPVETPVVAETPVVSSSPLVQIIVNVNQQEASVPAPSPVVAPSPVIIAPTPEVAPSPVIVAPTPVAVPEPVIVVPGPTMPVNPVDIVAITPPQAIINPIDVIAITAPEVNPIDIASPIVVPAGVAGQVVGPIV